MNCKAIHGLLSLTLGGLALVLTASSCDSDSSERVAKAGQRAIFGETDFVEYPDIQGDAQRSRSNAVGILLNDVSHGLPLACDDFEGSCDLPIFVVGQAGEALCPDQPPLSDQPSLIVEEPCSAFLVDDHTLVAAAHCFTAAADPATRETEASQACSNKLVVFGFTLGRPEPSFVAQQDVHRCSAVRGIGDGTFGEDWIVFDVERSVTGRAPLELRRQGEVAVGTPLETAGYPAGLPLKLVDGAEVKAVSADEIRANVDELTGSSGSPVVNADTGEVEGILVAGPASFEIVNEAGEVVPPGTPGACLKILASCPNDVGCHGSVPFTSIVPIQKVLASLPADAQTALSLTIPAECGASDASTSNNRPYTGPRTLAVVPRSLRHDALPAQVSQEDSDTLLAIDCPGSGPTPLNRIVLLDPAAPSSFDSAVATILPRQGGNWRALAYRADRADLIGLSHAPGSATFQVLSIVVGNGSDGCEDSCAQALDGVCDDGGPGSAGNSCAPGTDCSDCGELTFRESCLDNCGPNDDGTGALAANGVCEDGGPDSVSSACAFGADCQDCTPRLVQSRALPPGATSVLFEASANDRIPIGLSWNADAGTVAVLLDAQEPGQSATLLHLDESGQAIGSATPIALDACAGTVDPPDAPVTLSPPTAAGLFSAEAGDAVLCVGTNARVLPGGEVTTEPAPKLLTIGADGAIDATLPAGGVLADPECDSTTFQHKTVAWGLNRQGTLAASVVLPRDYCLLGGAAGAALLPFADVAGGFFGNVANGGNGPGICPEGARDSDDDGIKDCWERRAGFDLNLDGTNEYDFPAGDLPTIGVRDVYLEIDFMGDDIVNGKPLANSNHRPSQTALGKVVATFNNAPAFVQPRIALHIEAAGDTIPHTDLIAFDLGIDPGESRPTPPPGVPLFSFLKKKAQTGDAQLGFFGTKAQRNHAQAQLVRLAKGIFFRYAIWAHSLFDTGSTGMASIGGNSFVVTLAPGPGTEKLEKLQGVELKDDLEAGTFLHELGHTLNLKHGGKDDSNHKPNYLSVMNYFFQDTTKVQRALDFSGQDLTALQEDGGLDEPIGVSATPPGPTAWWSLKQLNGGPCLAQFGIGGPNCALQTGQADGSPLNWNAPLNNVATDLDASADLNGDGRKSLLRGHNDWAHIRVRFTRTNALAEGIRLLASSEGPLNDFSTDTDGDGITDPFDNCTLPNADQADFDQDGIGDLCDINGPIRLLAERHINAPNVVDGSMVFATPRPFVLPAFLGLVSGSTQRSFVTLSFRVGTGPLIECRYNQATPRNGGADGYEFKRCSNATSPGATFQADQLLLHVERQGTKEIDVTVEAILE